MEGFAQVGGVFAEVHEGAVQCEVGFVWVKYQQRQNKSIDWAEDQGQRLMMSEEGRS